METRVIVGLAGSRPSSARPSERRAVAASVSSCAEGIADIEKIGLAYCKNRVELCR